MGQIKIYFAGVCVFVDRFSTYFPGNAPIHRMVLVNADMSELRLGDSSTVQVVPHLALMTLDPPFEVVMGPLPPQVSGTNDYILNGGTAYTITVLNPVTTQGWINSATCLPSLQSCLDVPIGAPSAAVVKDGNAACYVDFTDGILEGFSQQGSQGLMGISRATIETNGNPVLQITGGPLMLNTIVNFGSADVVAAITNKPAEQGADDPNDFFFNYLVCADLPDVSEITPPDAVGCPPITPSSDPDLPKRIQHFDAGPGCSNTGFP